ncbi:aquaporin [Hyalangium versicolor]|uniref:aquaporin n=1 Tax=Hyalangium versicolor TaxID=2861190 RepID=UPI001CCCFE94|nr:aquaporin [Hyalangium versicolor]
MRAQPHSRVDLRRRMATEALGCGLLVVALEGAHHIAEHLGASALEGRLFMSLAAGSVLACMTLVLRPLSGAHFNPALTFADALEEGAPWHEVPLYAVSQMLGGLAGRLLAHVMCSEPLLIAVRAPAAGTAQFLTELVATFGLLVVVCGCVRLRPSSTPFAIAAYVAATVWFTDSRSLANPALVLARAASARPDTIRPFEVESFVAAQLLGAALAVCLFRWLLGRNVRAEAPRKVVFTCAVPGPAQLAAALFNSLAHPQFAFAEAAHPSTGEAGVPAPVEGLIRRMGLTPAVLRVRAQEPEWVILLELPEGPPLRQRYQERWLLPARPLESSEDARALAEELRPRLRQLLVRQGWERLHVVESPSREGPHAVT